MGCGLRRHVLRDNAPCIGPSLEWAKIASPPGAPFSLRSGLENDPEGRGAGGAFCDLVQGSDVADFTPGHELQDKDGETVKVCPTRDD
ncbi:MAG: hypothetical protein ACSLFD_05945 [Solirubrobacterales bacterium]